MIRKYNRTLASLLAFMIAAGGAGGVWADDFSTGNSDVDRYLSSEAGKIAVLEKLVQEQPTLQQMRDRCRGSFSVSELLRGSGGESWSADFKLNVIQHQACLSVLDGNAAPCAEIRNPPAGGIAALAQNRDLRCEDLSWDLLRSKMLMIADTQPSLALQMCQAMLERSPDLRIPVDPRVFCQNYIANASNVEQRVARLQALVGNAAEGITARLLRYERSYSGLSTKEECLSNDFGWANRQTCVAARLYREAYLKSDAAVCGGSGFCRALLGVKDGACRVYADSLAEAYCSQADPSGREFVEWRNKRQQLVGGANAIRSELGSVMAHQNPSEDRKQKFVSLMARCDSIRKALDPNYGKKPKRAPKRNEE